MVFLFISCRFVFSFDIDENLSCLINGETPVEFDMAFWNIYNSCKAILNEMT